MFDDDGGQSGSLRRIKSGHFDFRRIVTSDKTRLHIPLRSVPDTGQNRRLVIDDKTEFKGSRSIVSPIYGDEGHGYCKNPIRLARSNATRGKAQRLSAPKTQRGDCRDSRDTLCFQSWLGIGRSQLNINFILLPEWCFGDC